MSVATTTCARCGKPVEPGEHLCAQCREEGPGPVMGRPDALPESDLEQRERRWPPGMPRPSPVQYHATIMVTVAVVLIGLGVFAFLNHRGVGPFTGTMQRTQVVGPSSIRVVVSVANEGSKTGRSTCRITAVDTAGQALTSDTVLTEPIPADRTVTVRTTLRALSATPDHVSVFCR
jgi:hypothetical protein